MIHQVNESRTEDQISLKAVAQFGSIFKVSDIRTRKFCIQKAYRWYSGRHSFLNALKRKENKVVPISSKSIPDISVKKCAVKALAGRGRKRQYWVEHLHSVLLSEFERYSSSRVQLSRGIIQHIALQLLQEPDSPFTAYEIDPVSNKQLSSYITLKWVDAFLNRHNIVIRKQSGSLSRSPTHTKFIEGNVAFHLEQLHRLFENGNLDENMVENVDETHYIFNMDDHETLGVRGVKKVSYADVVS